MGGGVELPVAGVGGDGWVGAGAGRMGLMSMRMRREGGWEDVLDLREGNGDDEVVERDCLVLELIFDIHITRPIIRWRWPAINCTIQ